MMCVLGSLYLTSACLYSILYLLWVVIMQHTPFVINGSTVYGSGNMNYQDMHPCGIRQVKGETKQFHTIALQKVAMLFIGSSTSATALLAVSFLNRIALQGTLEMLYAKHGFLPSYQDLSHDNFLFFCKCLTVVIFMDCISLTVTHSDTN